MGVRVGLVSFVVVFCCLIQAAVSVHKKKIIVKVPHIIKHIHHDHFKPMHIHKVHAKKLEHHHDDDHEGETEHGGWKQKVNHQGWKPSSVRQGYKIGKRGKLKPYGSFSNLKPVLLHKDMEEQLEYMDIDEHEHGGHQVIEPEHKLRHDHSFDLNQRQEVDSKLGFGQNIYFREDLSKYVPEHTFQQESYWNSGDKPVKRKRRKQIDKDTFGGSSKLKAHEFASWVNAEVSSNDYNGEGWHMPREYLGYQKDPRELIGKNEFYNSKEIVDNGYRNKKHKQSNFISKEIGPKSENNGWKPIINFNKWKDSNKEIEHNYGEHQGQFIESGEDYGGRMQEDHYQIHSDDSAKMQKKHKKKKGQKWSKYIEIQEHTDENNPESLQRLHNHQSYQVESPSFPIVPQVQTQLVQPLQVHHQQPQHNPIQMIQNDSPHVGLGSHQQQWGNQHQQLWPTQQQQQWSTNHQQHQQLQQQHHEQHQQHIPVAPMWPTQPTPILAQPTEPPKMVWSGHHLEMPQHTMWHVQQHVVGQAPSMQVLSVNHNHPPNQNLQIPQSLLPLRQEPQQSVSANQVLPPGWPLTHDRKTQDPHSPMMQRWEQHVQTSGSGGPASSYKVEVINYMDQKSNRQ